MDVKEAAKRLECSPSLVYALVDEGRLRCVRLGRRGRRGKIVILDEHLQTFLDEMAFNAENN